MRALQDHDLDDVERACLQLVHRYCHLIDHGAASRVAELFTEDGVWTSSERAFAGREQIALGFTRRQEDAGRMSRHVCSTFHLELEGRDAARGVTYLTLYRHDGPPGRRTSRVRGPSLVGEYRDRFVRTDAGWLIQSRDVVTAFLFEETDR